MPGPEDIPGLEPHEVVTMRQVQTFLDIPCPSSIPSNKVVIACRYVCMRFLFKRFVTQKKTQVRNATGKLLHKLVTNRGVQGHNTTRSTGTLPRHVVILFHLVMLTVLKIG